LIVGGLAGGPEGSMKSSVESGWSLLLAEADIALIAGIAMGCALLVLATSLAVWRSAARRRERGDILVSIEVGSIRKSAGSRREKARTNLSYGGKARG
jgi:hypothetical protein